MLGRFLIASFLLSLLFGPGALLDAEGADKPLKIHLISGSKEYKSEDSLKEFKGYLEKHYRVVCTASWSSDGATRLDNLEALESADLMVVFARRLKLGEEQLAIIRAHWEAGKPMVGIRTASHAFQKADNEVFDRKVLGNNYSGHYGDDVATISVVEKNAAHPVLAGVKPLTSTKLYKAGELASDTIVLQVGDIGKGPHPVTMVHTYKGGRVFYTSLGTPGDFKNSNFRRMLVNAIFWTTHRQMARMKK